MKIYLRSTKIINILLLFTLLTSTIIGSAVPSQQGVALAAEARGVTAITLDGLRDADALLLSTGERGDILSRYVFGQKKLFTPILNVLVGGVQMGIGLVRKGPTYGVPDRAGAQIGLLRDIRHP